MPTDSERQDEPGTAPALRLPSAWADYSKALAIYPETNARVRVCLEGMQAALDARLRARGGDAERGITVLFRDTEVHVDRERLEIGDDARLRWLRDRLMHAGLAGVEWLPGLDGDALAAFTRQLLANHQRKDPGLGYDDLWPDTYPGLVLIDRRFEGTFGGVAVEGSYAGGHGGTGVAAANTNHFVRGLLAHPKVTRRVSRLAGLDTAEDEATVSAADLLAGILEEVPAEALESRDALITTVCRVLDELRDAPAAGPASAGDREFAALLQEASRSHFAREGPALERLHPDAEEEVVSTPGGGRKRDEVIDDDVETLLAEVGSLPTAPTYDLDRGDADSDAEQLAVGLHYFVHLEHPERLPGLRRHLERLLAAPGREELTILEQHIAPQGRMANAGGRTALVRLLLELGHGTLLRRLGVLGSDFVRHDLPTRLPLFLAGLEARDAASQVELDDLLAEAGEGLLDLDGLLPGLATLDEEPLAAVMARPTRVRLPLLRLLLDAQPERMRPLATTFLRALDLPEDEAFVLFHLGDARHISHRYLCRLVDQHLGRGSAQQTQEAVVDLLCQHVRATREPRADCPERLASIHCLGRYGSERAAQMLRELQKTMLGPFGAAEPSSVRKLARTTLKRVEGLRAGGGQGHRAA